MELAWCKYSPGYIIWFFTGEFRTIMKERIDMYEHIIEHVSFKKASIITQKYFLEYIFDLSVNLCVTSIC